MKIGLVDVDGHHFPNLALMRISAYHKQRGDSVEWLNPMLHYDVAYISKVFSDAYTPDIDFTPNADKVFRGGTGYAITNKNGKEHYDLSKWDMLIPEIEYCFPDYSIYPQYDYAVSMTSRGCPRGCPWCHIKAKEGCFANRVANVEDFYAGQKIIKVLDANLFAIPMDDKFDLLKEYISTGAYIDFTQGLDIRLLTDLTVDYLNRMKIENIHFAWDDPTENLKNRFAMYASRAKHKPHGSYGAVYVLTNYNSTMEQNLYRIYTLRDLGYDPYVMIYDKPHAPKEIKRLQRWCNNIRIFKSTKRFEDYL